jgi:glutamate N-acetyltransferase/amino-acid N-acetyltransferase
MAELHLLSPRGFRAGGVYAGIKSRNTPDVGLIVCDRPATAAAVFTANRVVSPAVRVGREHIAEGKLQAVVVNSGNANACTGRQGERDARRMCELAGDVVDCDRRLVLPSSTGIIGHHLPMNLVERGIAEAGQYLGSSAEHANLFGDAILTTDTRRKAAAVEFKLGRHRVVLAGVTKGSGMIGPRLALPGAALLDTAASSSSSSRSSRDGKSVRGTVRGSASGKARPLRGAAKRGKRPTHATMLAYLTTDAQVPVSLLRRLLGGAADASFNAVTVDDQASTNDTAALLASGAGDGRVDSPAAERAFAAALREVCQSLAYQIAADGEGATKVVVITVKGARSESDARVIAREIANSPLVKCAMHGNDPNWGRIICAAGFAGPPFDADKATLSIQGTVVFRNGQPVSFDAAAVSEALKAAEVRVELNCRAGKAEATCWTCDLSKEYVTINADYHT